MDGKCHHQISEIAHVLKGQNKKINKIDYDAQKLQFNLKEQGKELDDLLAQSKYLCDSVDIDMPKQKDLRQETLSIVNTKTKFQNKVTWEDLISEYEMENENQVLLDNLLPPETIKQINAKFEAPLRRIPWDKTDYIVVFGAALVGIIADWFCAPIGNPLSSQIKSYGTDLHDRGGIYKGFGNFQEVLSKSSLAERFPWVEHIAEMKPTHHNLPIDYSGKHFGGSHHRVLSGGHDILRFMGAIWQIKNGQFQGVRYEHGQAIMEVMDMSHRGNDYIPRGDWATAAIEYLLHIVADFFTETSLPIPGATLLREVPYRDVRKFVAESYQGGYSLRHVVGQAVTPAVTSLIVWIYYLIRYKLGDWIKVNIKKETVEKEMVPGLKLNEMLAVAHTVVTGVNIGKIVITQNPLALNLPQLFMCLKQLLGLAYKNFKRYDLKAKYKRNQLYLDERWSSLETFINQPVSIDEKHWPKQPILLAN